MKTTKISVLFLFFILIFSACEKDTDNDLDDGVIGQTIEVEEDITSNTTWYEGNIYIIERNIDIYSGAILTIEPGVIVKFQAGKYLTASYSSDGFGTIIAEGSTSKPITFTSAATNKNPGDWGGIWLYEGAAGSKFKHCKFEYSGGYSTNYGTIISDVNFSFDYCIIENGAEHGILFKEDAAGFNSFTNNTFRTIEKNPVKICAQSAHTLGTNNNFDNTNNISLTRGDVLESGNVTWLKQNVPYQIDGVVKVGSSSGTTLNFPAGSIIKFGPGSYISVSYTSSTYGAIEAEGTASEPITFTSAAPFPSKGDWDGIWFYEGTTLSSFKNCTLSYGGGYSSNSGNIYIRNDIAQNVTIEDCNINDSQAWGIYKTSGSEEPTLNNVSYSNNTSGDKNF